MAKSYTIIDKSQYAMKFYADNLSNKKFGECVDACKKNVDIKNYSSCILYDEMLQQIISKISSTRNNKASSLKSFKQQIAKALYQRVFAICRLNDFKLDALLFLVEEIFDMISCSISSYNIHEE